MGLCLGREVGNRPQPASPTESHHTKLSSWLQSWPCSLGLASGWVARVLGWHSLTSAGGEAAGYRTASGLWWPREPLGPMGTDSTLDIPSFPCVQVI